MATRYHACFGKQPGFKNTATADNARSCSDFQQYIGKVGMENAVAIGTHRAPGDATITEVEVPAKEHCCVTRLIRLFTDAGENRFASSGMIVLLGY
jgi:hypothetical protein